ncbi:Ig-like domain-containing protein [Actinoplanes regularis]|uniref:Ig-like domain-containing protein n=1 Tax=Actinoplanes regularis TaxID=52697 RepID=UPI0024A1EC4D|nr:Ig-like domain-containing protein [Actinoplanes regularis]GLW30038.1 hypothetical protein Areg01_29780 [Actinoplanes regularis]
MTAATVVATVATGVALISPAQAADAPVLDLGIAAGTRISKTVTVEPTLADGTAPAELVLYANNAPVAFDRAAPWALRWNTLDVTHYIVDQDVLVYLAVRDAAGNVTKTDPVTVRVDNYAPISDFPWSSGLPQNKQNSFTGIQEFNLTPRQDAATVAKIELLVGDQVIDTATAAPWTVRWDTSAYSGQVTLHSRTYDDLGNVTTVAQYAFVDRTPPTLAVRFPEVAGFVSVHEPIAVEAYDPASVEKVELLVNGELVRTDRTICCNGLGVVDLAWDPAAGNGPATMTVRAYDTLGNIAEYTRAVTVDNDRPVVTVTPAGTYLRGTFTAGVTNVQDTTGLTYLASHLDNWQVGAHTRQQPWTVQVNSRAVADGRHTLAWDAMDKAGNMTTVRRVVYIDNTAPSVKITKAPKNKAKLTKTTTFTASASDQYGIARVQLLVNGKVVAADTKAAYTFSLNPKKYGKTFTVQVRAYDRAGNARYTSKLTYRR